MKAIRFSAIIVTASLAVASTARATTTFTPIAGNVLMFAPMTDGTGIMAEFTDGSLSRLALTGAGWGTQPRIPGGNAVGPKGVTVASNVQTGATYVFEIEKSGLWANHLIDGNNEWSGWCNFDGRHDLVTPPTAAPVGNGFSVFAVASDYSLVQWRIDEGGSWCSSVTSSTIGTAFDAMPPVAVSWGGTRVDVFAQTVYPPSVEHFWSDDGKNYGWEESFSIGGKSQYLPVDEFNYPWSAVSVGYGHLDLLYIDDGAGGTRKRLIQRLNWSDGWSLHNMGIGEQAIVDASTLTFLTTSLLVDYCSESSKVCDGLSTSGSTAYFPAGVNYPFEVAGVVLNWDLSHHLVMLGDDRVLYVTNSVFN